MPYALFCNDAQISKAYPSEADVWQLAQQSGLVVDVSTDDQRHGPRRVVRIWSGSAGSLAARRCQAMEIVAEKSTGSGRIASSAWAAIRVAARLGIPIGAGPDGRVVVRHRPPGAVHPGRYRRPGWSGRGRPGPE